MGIMHGKAGKVVWNAEDGGSDIDISHVTSWSIDATADTAESTAMGDTYKAYKGGFNDWTATVECIADGTPEVLFTTAGENDGLGEEYEDDGTTRVRLELWFTATAGDGILYGAAVATGIAYVEDKDDVVKVTYTFQGTDTLATSATEPTY